MSLTRVQHRWVPLTGWRLEHHGSSPNKVLKRTALPVTSFAKIAKAAPATVCRLAVR